MSDFNDDDGLVETKKQGRVWPIVAPIVLILLAAMLIFTVAAGIFGDDEGDVEEQGGSAPAGQPATTAPPSVSTDSDDSLCGLEGNETAGTLTEPPSDVEWQQVGPAGIPTSPTSGPGVVEPSQVRYCFAHTRAGAVLAASNVYAWGVASSQDPVGVIENGVSSGPGYEAALSEAQTADQTGSSQDPSLQLAGFQLLSYTSETALVSVLIKDAGTMTYAQQSLELVWERGDWRVRTTPDGSMPQASIVDDLTGYVIWPED